MNRVECGSIAGERRALESVALKGLGESLGSEAEVTAAADKRRPRVRARRDGCCCFMSRRIRRGVGDCFIDFLRRLHFILLVTRRDRAGRFGGARV